MLARPKSFLIEISLSSLRNLRSIKWFSKVFTHNLHVSLFNKCLKELVIHSEQEFFCSTFAAQISKSFSTLFLLILKCFQRVFKTFLAALLPDMKCLPEHYSNFDFSGLIIKHDIFYFFGEKSVASVIKVWAAISNPEVFASLLYVIQNVNVPCLSTSRYYHLVSWGIPFVVACLPLINDHYGPAGAWW